MVSAYTDLHVEGGVDYFAVFAPFLSCGGEKTVACEPPKDGREVIVPVDDARASKDPLQVPGFCYHHVQFVPQVKSATEMLQITPFVTFQNVMFLSVESG